MLLMPNTREENGQRIVDNLLSINVQLGWMVTQSCADSTGIMYSRKRIINYHYQLSVINSPLSNRPPYAGKGVFPTCFAGSKEFIRDRINRKTVLNHFQRTARRMIGNNKFGGDFGIKR